MIKEKYFNKSLLKINYEEFNSFQVNEHEKFLIVNKFPSTWYKFFSIQNFWFIFTIIQFHFNQW